MARLASQAKMGYYPTPPGIVEHIKNGLALSGSGHYRLLDTCCGEGEALAQLVAGLGPGVETYGIELDEDRYRKASRKLDYAIHGDALTELRVSSQAFSLLWLNPPYDWDDDGGRLERQFLWAHLKYLAPDGWLVFIIPQQALKSVAGTLAKLSQVRIYAFPKPDFDQFKQVVVLGRNKKTEHVAVQLSVLSRLAADPPEEVWERLPKTSEIPPGSIILPHSPDRPISFSSERPDLEKTAALVAGSPLWKELEALTAPKTLNEVRPPAPLRQGHLAMLLAGGLMDGLVESRGKRLIIKGAVRKKIDTVTEMTDAHTIERRIESFHIVVRAIDLNAKKIITIS